MNRSSIYGIFCWRWTEYLTESADEVDDSIAIQTRRSGENAIDGNDNTLWYRLSNRFFDTRCNRKNESNDCEYLANKSEAEQRNGVTF